MRRAERQITDPSVINDILDRALTTSIGLCADNQPYVVPMSYGYEMVGDELHVYLHGAKEGHKLDVIRSNSACCLEFHTDVTPIAGDAACNHSTAYASVIAFGNIEILEDANDKIHGLTTIMKTQTKKDFTFNEQQASAVAVMRFVSKEFTGKRHEMPS